MRLLVINPNSSASVTRRIEMAIRSVITSRYDVLAIEATSAPALIINENDNSQAEQAVVDTVKHLGNKFDGIIVASFGDTGVYALRQWVTCPVIGIGHSALLTACAIGGPFAIVSFSPAVIPSMQQVVERYGMQHLLNGIHVVETPLPEDPGAIQVAVRGPLLELCKHIAEQGECRSIILGGGPLAGLAHQFAPEINIPIIDAPIAAVNLLRTLH
ncbi:aspartate/glutamate racemase family protein [Vreelandella olivaria]|uniref:aspartate/glutamate racemase family protein n=1 Tax=Vreelandella olivaria TaxID=390919 RepID=UPI00201F53FA|nr:aspartate/glutamate racemase family protein [Halomonas olivaria]